MAITITPPNNTSPIQQPIGSQQVAVQVFTAIATDTVAPIEYTSGDLIERVVVYSSAGAVVSETWKNITTGLTMASAPQGVDLAAKSTSPLTDAELRASAVHVIVDNQVTIPGPAATPNAVMIEMFTTIANGPGYVAGDILRREVVADTTVTPYNVLSEEWYNVTQGTLLTGFPVANTIAAIPNNGLTNTELRASPVEVYVVNQTSGAASPTTLETFVTGYIALADDSFGGEYLKGDILQNTIIMDNSTSPASEVSNVWLNTRTSLLLSSPPSGSAIAQTSTNGLTDAELRASAIHVIVDNQQPSVSPITNYATESFVYIANVTDAANIPPQYVAGDMLQNIQTIDTSTTPVTVIDNAWKNLTQKTVLTTPPVGSTISLTASNGLTDAELRASPLVVSDPDILAQLVAINAARGTGVGNDGALAVYVTNQISEVDPISNIQITTERYVAIAATNGPTYAVGNIIKRITTIDTTTQPSQIVSDKFYNLTLGEVDITSSVILADLAIQQADPALTNAELRAAPIEVYVTNQPVSDPASNYETVATTYTCMNTDVVNSPVEYVKDDIVQNIQVVDKSVFPVNVLSDQWKNITRSTSISMPLSSDLSMASSQPLTNVELRATPVDMKQTNFVDVETELLQALADGTGYTKGDIIRRTSKTGSDLVETVTWFNVTTDASIAKPAAGTIGIPSGTSLSTETMMFIAEVDNATLGYSANDELQRTVQWNNDSTPPVAVSDVWTNLTTGVTLSSPAVIGEYRVYTGRSSSKLMGITIARVTDAGNVEPGAYSIAVMNIGYADAIVDGVFIPPGISLDWTADVDDYLEELTFDATGTELLITIQRPGASVFPPSGINAPSLLNP